MDITATQQSDFCQQILCLMVEGDYQNAAESVLKHAEDLAKQAENISRDKKEALLEKSDRTASAYRDLIFLSSNIQLRKLHQTQKSQIVEMRRKANKAKDITAQIENNVAKFIEVYELLCNLFVIYQTRGNILNSALARLKSFSNSEPSYSSAQLLDDLFKLLELVEPASSKLSFHRDRRQILGMRYKCERGYANALELINNTNELFIQYRKITPSDFISYQEMYWQCGIEITSTVHGIINKIKD